MLDHTLLFIRNLLDAHLCRRLGIDHSIVSLNHLGSNDPALLLKNQNQLVITLVGLEYETSKRFYNTPSNQLIRKNPPICFNLKLLVAANFDDYIETLKVLSETILFFQASAALQASEYPDMPVGLTALQFEVENASESKEFDLWSALGAKYIPSLLYKVRHITMDASQISGLSTSTDTISVEVDA